MELEIRPLREEDVDAVAGIEMECFTSEAWPKDDFLSLSREKEGPITALVGVYDGEVAGYVCGSCVFGEAEIYSVAVKKEFRRRGTAAALISELERIYEPERAFLEVRRSNEAAKALYRSLGFECMGVRRGYYSNPEEDAITMIKTYKKEERG